MRFYTWITNQSSDPDDTASVFALVAIIHWSLVSLLWSAAARLHGWSSLEIASPLPGATTAFQAVLGIVGFGLAVSAIARLYWRLRLSECPSSFRGLLGGVVIWATASVVWALLISGIPRFLGRVTAPSVDVWNAVTVASSWMGLVLFRQFLIPFGTGVVVLALSGYVLERMRLERPI